VFCRVCVMCMCRVGDVDVILRGFEGVRGDDDGGGDEGRLLVKV